MSGLTQRAASDQTAELTNNNNLPKSPSLNHPDHRKSALILPKITTNGGQFDDRIDADSEKSSKSLAKSSNRAQWEILEGLKDGQTCEEKPGRLEGFLMKRRKWPLKGWHKRYFVLVDGTLSYAKNPADFNRGKIHGSVDVGLSVISTKSSSRRIDIDAEECIYHLKVKNKQNFLNWVAHLRHHRLYRQHEIAFSNKISPVRTLESIRNRNICLTSTPDITTNEQVDSKVAAWFMDLDSTEDKELNKLQVKLVKLSALLQELESNSKLMPDRQEKKYRRKFLLRKNKKPLVDKKKLETVSLGLEHLKTDQLSHNLSSSHPNLPSENWFEGDSDSQSSNYAGQAGEHASLSPVQVAEEFLTLANNIHQSFRTLLKMAQSNQISARQLQNQSNQRQISENHTADVIFSLRQSLNEVLQQNSDLKSKLTRIHEISDVSTAHTPGIMSPMVKSDLCQDEDETVVHRQIGQTLSNDRASILSVSEYFDAENSLSACTSSSEDDEEESITDISDEGTDYFKSSVSGSSATETNTGRRSKLPVPQPDTGDLSLWSLLYKNIGKDLSKISMPVTLNEPLNVLQRLCEELEYCELLDKAAATDDPVQRMLLVIAFAVSPYSSSYYRAGHKPFNPLLGETYECIREDKGFRFIAEQVSHHPPVSACHAEGENYLFWQDMRIKSKFWGKSMEIMPIGSVHVLLKRTKKHFIWNKVTTCVHNLFKGPRLVDQYGEMTITDGELTCRLTFEKASYWSNKRYGIVGHIVDNSNQIIEKLFGKWNEALYAGQPPTAKCIWRPGTIPEDHELYYGFSRFAIELNELTTDLEKQLPPTDTRFRPDQRLLEEGNIKDAESYKSQLEQKQRERKRKREESGQTDYNPLWFRKETSSNGQEHWVYNDRYWQVRNSGGFGTIEFDPIW